MGKSMSSYFYIKLYHEILHDPKMGRLTDNLWRRVIEVFLLAGENGHDGNLPDVESMAWELRLSVEELEANLQALAKYNIVSLTPAGWHVTHFEKRQAAIVGKDRVSAHRDRAKKQAYYATETEETQDSNESVTTRYTDIELDIELKKSKKLSAGKQRTTPKDSTPKEWMDALYKLCGVDISLASSGMRKRISETGKALIASGAKLEDVERFGIWWSSDEWRAKNTPTPTPEKVRDNWSKMNGNGRSNGNTAGRAKEPEYTPEELARAARINAERKARREAGNV